MRHIAHIFILLLSTCLLTGCLSSRNVTEYFFDSNKPYEEISYNQLPERAIATHDACHTPNDIQAIYAGQLEGSGKKAYLINFTDGGKMLFDKNGRCLMMVNLAHGLPSCWTDQLPIYTTLHLAISNEMTQMTSKPWEVRILEVHPNGYLVKVGQGVDITMFIFDKNGRMKDILIEI